MLKRYWSVVLLLTAPMTVLQALPGLGPDAQVSGQEAPGAPPASAPGTVWVAPFATSLAQVQTDPGGPLKRRQDQSANQENTGVLGLRGVVRGVSSGLLGSIRGNDQSMVGDDAATVKAKAAQLLQSDLVSALQTVGISAQALESDSAPVSGDVVLDGQFVSIDEGSQVRRVAIGLGAGQSYLATQVQLHTLDNPATVPFLTFHSEGDSGMSPGVLVGGAIGSAITSAAVGAGVSGARSSRKGTPDDLRNTAHSIAKYLASYWEEQGWEAAQ